MAFSLNRVLPPELAKAAQEIKVYAKAYGLDFWDIVFEVLDYDELNEVAAYGGFPTRYPHWKFGMEYEQLSKGYSYGLQKIYELVINNDPCYAYLMKSNSMVDQKLVMAHVCGHADFFKNNLWFGHTNRKQIDEMANHGTRIRRYAERYGHENVENFVDCCLSIDNLIDMHLPGIKRRRPRVEEISPEEQEPKVPRRLRSKEYMDRFVNPPEFLEEQRRAIAEEVEKQKGFPEEPERDVLLFLIDHAPIERWQRDVLSMVREEAYYFTPQAQTKVMNEGWACLSAESLVFTDSGLITMAELVAGDASTVSDGEQVRAVYDQHVIRDHATVKLRTRLGFSLEGSNNHRVMTASGEWRRLDELSIGDRLRVSGGAGLWPQESATERTERTESLSVSSVRSVANTAVAELSKPRTGVAESVVRDFLRASFNDSGEVDASGVTFSTDAPTSERVQLLLLNFGILSARAVEADGSWRVRIVGPSFKEEEWEDEVVSIEHGRGDVYDISVAETHRYAAQGFINHNSYWHSRLMTEKILTDAEVIDYADHHAGTLGTRPGVLNPYKLGIELFRWIEERWNKGKFGKAWDECDDLEEKKHWDRKLGLGRQKIFEVRRIYNDLMFIDEFLTEDFAVENKLFTFEYNKQAGEYVIASREFKAIKEKLLFQLTNWGNPFIRVENGNYENRGELYLTHQHEGLDLKLDMAKDTLRNVQKIWNRPVHIETVVDKRRKVLTYDGRKHSERAV